MAFFVSVVALAAAILLIAAFRVTAPLRRQKICYRCALPATGQFMNLDYCTICKMVVMKMYPAVSHDPGFGFPGGPGYDPDGPDPYTARKETKGGGKKEV